jgi:isopenicillin N synthase-like dioxygenase
MRNERDWREQIHFGRERDAHASGPEYLQLEGPNLWPPDPAFRTEVGRYLEVVAGAGERLLTTIAEGFGLPRTAFGATAREGYQLLKMICYWAQPQVRSDRPGVAAHVDFSYVTLTLQDGPGLSVRNTDGTWHDVEPLAGAWWVHAGELLQFATRGFHEATPHRVTNRSADRTRLSLVFFVNPSLDAVVRAFDIGRAREQRPRAAEHVHHVLSRDGSGDDRAPFVFGEAEWRRKGLNHWCVDCTSG